MARIFAIIRSLFPCIVLWGLWVATAPASVVAQQFPDDNAEVIFMGLYGRIRVIDPTVLGAEQVAWFSPEEGFRHFVLGDVNADGDMEIIAIKGDGNQGKLIVYDPVLNSTFLRPDGVINNIPWKKLYERSLNNTPTTVVTGDLVPEVAGDEIIYSVNKGQDTSDLVILKVANALGTNWTVHETVSFSRVWEDITVGDIDREGADEIILSDPDGAIVSRIEAYRVDDGGFAAKTPFFFKESDDRRWISTVIGQVYPDGPGEVIALRKSEFQTPDNAFIFQYDPETTDVDKTLYDVDVSEEPGQELDDGFLFEPRAQVAFLGNINGVSNNESDHEVFFLRNTNFGNQPRLFMRNRGSDAPNFPEQFLDGDNGYKAGAAGDVDGDGKDEIVVMRNNRVRIYLEPDENINTLREDAVNTNAITLAVGDLDRNGFLSSDSDGLFNQVYLPAILR